MSYFHDRVQRIPPNKQSDSSDHFHGFSGTISLNNTQLEFGDEDHYSITSAVAYKPIKDSFFFLRSALTLNTSDEPLNYTWGIGYDDWHPGSWGFELNNWNPLAPGDGLDLENAIGSLTRKFKGSVLENNNLASSLSLNKSANSDFALTWLISWSPRPNWFIRTLITQSLEGGGTSWAYGFGYNNYRKNTFSLEYNNWGFNETFELFDDMAAQEHDHRRWLLDLHKEKFGDNVPLIRREHVRGYYPIKPLWLVKPYGIDRIRAQASEMEAQAWRFYTAAAERAEDASIRRLMGDLAEAEAAHVHTTETAIQNHTPRAMRDEEREKEHKQFVLTYVQPGLAGLMDGSVSTLAPIFATAFATQDTWTTFLVGIAASLGAGISMGFTEVASDDGVISGRGSDMLCPI